MSVSKYQKYFDKCINFNQNNKYHNLTLDKHIECAVNRAKELGYSDTIIEALKWHDFGKLFCATTDENGTHYIGHPQISADIYKESNDNEYVYNLIKLHNTPITTKLINKYGFEFCKDLMRVKECDDFAHNDYAKQNTRNVKEKQREQVVMKKAERTYKINKRLKSDFDYLQSLGYEVVCVCLQGSQNYNLDTDKSDIDTKAIVLPKFTDFIDDAKAVSTTIVLPSTEHIDVKDIRVMFDVLRKSNVNFLEILFTKYKILNKKYSKLIAPIFANAEKLAMSDKKALINCCYGMAMQKYVALKHPYPTIKDKIDKYGYDCYTEDTKFLTKDGWKLFKDIKDGEEVGTINPKTMQLEFQKPYDKFCKKYCGDIYDIETYNTHFKITPNHKIFSSPVLNINKNGHKFVNDLSNWTLESAEHIVNIKHSKKHRHFAVLKNLNEELLEFEGVRITDNLLKIIGAFVSEGSTSFRNGNVKNIRIYQTNLKRDNNQKFITMIDSIDNIKINKYESLSRNSILNKEIVWTITDKFIKNKIYEWCGHKSVLKHLPKFIFKLSKRQANILLESLCLGDGTEQKTRTVYYTISKKLAEDIQILSTMAEKYSVIMGGDKGYKNHCNFTDKDFYIYQISIKKESYEPNWCYFKEGKNVKTEHYEGNVVCFSVPNSTLVTQNNGKVAIQGNCKQLHHIIRMNLFLKDIVKGKSFKSSLIPPCIGYLISVKYNVHPLKTAERLAKENLDECKEIKEKALNENDFMIDTEAQNIYNKVKKDILTQWFREELNKVEV